MVHGFFTGGSGKITWVRYKQRVTSAQTLPLCVAIALDEAKRKFAYPTLVSVPFLFAERPEQSGIC